MYTAMLDFVVLCAPLAALAVGTLRVVSGSGFRVPAVAATQGSFIYMQAKGKHELRICGGK